MKLTLRTSSIKESKETKIVTDKKELELQNDGKVTGTTDQAFAAAQQSIEANKKAAEDAIKASKIEETSKQVAEEPQKHKNPAPKTIKLKPYTEATKVKDRAELANLITEAHKAGRKIKIQKCLEEGYRYIFEDFEVEGNEQHQINEDYGWNIPSDKAWEAWEEYVDAVGTQKAADDLARTLSYDDLADDLGFIFRENDFNSKFLSRNESLTLSSLVRYFNKEDSSYIDVTEEKDGSCRVTATSHGNIIDDNHIEVNGTKYEVKFAEDNDGKFLKLGSVGEDGKANFEFPFVFEKLDTTLESGSVNESLESGSKLNESLESGESGESGSFGSRLHEQELDEADERINLLKYGFVRAPEEDFSDDGNRFRCYWYDPNHEGDKRFRTSKLVDRGQAYIAVHYYSKSGSGRSKYFDDLNGVSVEDAVKGLPELVKKIEDFKQGIEEFDKVTNLSDEDITKLMDEIKFLEDRAGLSHSEAYKRAFVNLGIEYDTVDRKDIQKLSNAIRNNKPYDKEKLKQDVKSYISEVVKALTSYHRPYDKEHHWHSAESVEDALKNGTYHISGYPDAIQEKVKNHVKSTLEQLYNFKDESLTEANIKGLDVDKLANEIVVELEKDGLVENLSTTDNKSVNSSVINENKDNKLNESTLLPDNSEDELDIDNIETVFKPEGEVATNTFMSIQQAGAGTMDAFKDTLKDLYNLKLKVGDLQKLLSDSSTWLLNLLGITPDVKPVEVEPDELPERDETQPIDDLDVKPYYVGNETVDMNSFDDPEPIYDDVDNTLPQE